MGIDELREEMRREAEQGDAGAQYNLGIAYANGQGVPKDIEQATAWWRKAAEQGHESAKVALAILERR
jgi:uncharacterized protein